MAGAMYNSAFVAFMSGDIDLLNDTIIAMLLDSNYVPNVDNDDFIADISADEISGGGYARDTLTTPAVTQDDSGDRGEFSSDDITGWSGDTFTGARYMVLAKSTGNDATSQLIAYFDFLEDKDAGFDVAVPSQGWFAIGACP